MNLVGKRCLVTGGAIRVGRALVELLADRGARVAFTYRSSRDAALELQRQLSGAGVEAHALPCELSDAEGVARLIAECRALWGGVDVLINNASLFRRTPLTDATLDDWDDQMNANLRAPWLLSQAFGPEMKQRGEGIILNMLDIAAERPYPGYLPYCASKAGLVALTKGLARVLAPEVRVNGIAPGTVLWPDDYPEEQKQRTLAKTPMRGVGSPEDIAAAARYLIEDAPFVTGVVLPVDGGRLLV